MKFQTLEAFEKHLREAFPKQLAPLYLILCPAKGDRDALIQRLKTGFCKLDPHLELSQFNGTSLQASQIKASISSQSLFSKKNLILIEEVDKIKKSEIAPLTEWLQKLPEDVRILMSGSSSQGLDGLLALEKKDLVLLDLSKEKPWERKERLVEQLVQIVRREGAELLPDAALLLIDKVGLEMADLISECQKLACFVGERGVVDKRSVEALIRTRAPLKRFKVSQDWVFVSSDMPRGDLEADDILQWLGQIRYHLQVGLKLSLLPPDMQKGEAQLAQLNPKELARLSVLARSLGPHYFQRGMQLLLDTEMDAKQGSLSEELLLQHFIGKLDHARKTHSAA